MYEALSAIENLIAENSEPTNEQSQKVIQQIFSIAQEALKEEDNRAELAFSVELYKID